MLPTANDRTSTRGLLEPIFDPFFERLVESWPLKSQRASSLAFPLDVLEEDDKYIVLMNAPGIEKDNIDISLEGHTLTINVKSQEEKNEERKNYIFRERFYGSTTRTITLPHGTTSDEISAELKDGVLKIYVPKKPELKAKKINIK